MGRSSNHFLLLLLFLLLFWPNHLEEMQASAAAAVSVPLSTSSRWVVDGGGRRVKLACVNWVTHLEAAVAEGLSKQPLDAISKKVAAMGFNCVRLTWPLFLATNDTLAGLTVRQSLQGLGLLESAAAVKVNNPALIDLSLIHAFQAVVSSLGSNDVMVVLDNHISKPGWCCSNFDGNGFFGDRYFDPELWIKGLTRMATLFNGSSNVVGMSLRNELRGPRQNLTDWYRYMARGAEAVHAANPDVLVILSGLSFDNDLSFLAGRPVGLTFTGKLVFELHWYGFSDGRAWESGNPNQVCGAVAGNVMRRGGFLLEQGWPLFLSEFGADQRGTNVNDNRYMSCMLGVAAELDLDWALWALQGSYYLREGVLGLDEVYGVLGWDWCGTRNASYLLQRLSALQSPLQGPGLSDITPYKIIFHPATGLCVTRRSLFEPPELGPCTETDPWEYTPQRTLAVRGTLFCLRADDDVGRPAKIGVLCGGSNSKWDTISDSKMHLATTLPSSSSGSGNVSSTVVCLDVADDKKTLVTNPCKCLSRDRSCEPDSQWFKIVSSSKNLVDRNNNNNNNNSLLLKLPSRGMDGGEVGFHRGVSVLRESS